MAEYGNPLSAFGNGWDQAQGVFDRYNRVKAGNMLARGDSQGAQRAFYSGGLIDEGRQMEADQQVREDRTREIGRQEKADQLAKQRETLGYLKQAAVSLRKVPAEQRAAAFEQLAPSLSFLDPQMVEQLRAAPKDDASLDFFLGDVEKAELQFFQTDQGILAGDQRTGKVDMVYAAPPKPKGSWKERTLRDQSTEWFWLDETPPGAGSAMAPTGSPGMGGAPRSVRNNNPGNIEDGEFARSLPGYKGSDGRFAVFETPEAGEQAQAALLQSYGRRGFNTVSKIINRWAPPSENDSAGYASFVAQKLGVSPDQQLDMSNPQVISALQGAIAEFEGGTQSRSNGTAVAQRATVPGSAPKVDEMSKRQTAQTSIQLRTQFNNEKEVQAFNDVAASYTQVKRLAKPNATPADDLALTYSFMKMLDPGSVVREGEFAMVGQTAGLPDQVIIALQRIDQGKGLTPPIRQRLVQAAATVYSARQGRYNQLVGQYQGYAKDLGLPDSTITARIAADGPARATSSGDGNRPKLTPAQSKTIVRLKADKSGAPSGSRQNPYVTRTQQDYDSLPSGSHYIFTDGRIMVKP